MEYKVYYNGRRTSDFDTLASWFQELKDKNRSLGREYSIAQDHITENEDCIHSMSKDISELQRRNRSLESDNDILKEKNKILMAEREKTNEVLKRYCGDSVDAPIPTIVGLIIDDYFYQKAETENLVRALQNAEKTIEGMNKELVEYADKAEKLEKKLWDPDWCQLIDKLNEIIDGEAPRICPPRKVYTHPEDEIWDKLNYLTGSLCFRNILIRAKDKNIRRLENKVNDLDVTNRKLKLENEKLILAQGDGEIEHAVEITDLKKEISALKTELEERKNKRSPRWPSDVMRICVLEGKVNELTRENERLRYSQPWMYGMSSKEATNRIFGINGTIHKLMEENDKLKEALEFCQKEASSAREHAHNVEVNAERIRKGLD